MLNHIELANKNIIFHPFRPNIKGYVIFTEYELASYTNAVIEMCKEHVRGENAYCSVMLDDLKVKG